ncbi:histidine phosphatase family protein [Jannaschia sp. 2305UL9-9]|uniref:SixA phosphatase family protein n=1 Tax=Jannaschia sp. 2305UL9-9 TaxID=3121638 RepID=UPI003526F0BE
MKLILLRHAKSDWEDPLQEDRDRPLNRRGRDVAPRVGGWLRANRHVPDLILCSSAVRTRQTRAALGFDDVPTDYQDALYLAGPDTILAAANRRADIPTVMVIAHNPGIAEAAAQACAPRPVHPDFARYPTCACTIIEGPFPGKPVAFLVPRDL